ncbi:super-infection exclusion protein B [Yersinia enterocolitica]|nr:superinfection exclusion B family protein [Yersinia enterocolitica]
MNNDWWRDVLRFFLDGLTLRQLIHMIIMLIVLIVITPTTFKEWVNLHNPEILPPYWMYYALLFCISYVMNGFISSFIQWPAIKLMSLFHGIQSKMEVQKAEKVILNLSEEEKALIVDIIDNGSYISDGDANETLMSLVYKEVIYSCQNKFSSEYKLTDLYKKVVVGMMVRTLNKK